MTHLWSARQPGDSRHSTCQASQSVAIIVAAIFSFRSVSTLPDLPNWTLDARNAYELMIRAKSGVLSQVSRVQLWRIRRRVLRAEPVGRARVFQFENTHTK